MMRPAFASLTAALMAAAATAALAQTTPDAGQTPPPPAPAMSAPAPDMAAPAPGAAQPGMAQPGMAQPAPGAAPGPPAAAAPAETPAAPPAPPPPPQTSPEGNYALQMLNEVCIPLLHHGDIKAITKAHGFRQSRGIWTLKLDEGKYITLSPPTGSNPHICSLDITFDVDAWRPIVETLNNWAYQTHQPPLQMLYQGYRPMNNSTTTWSWQYTAPTGGEFGLAFNVPKKNGNPAAGKFDLGTLLVTDTLPAS